MDEVRGLKMNDNDRMSFSDILQICETGFLYL